MRSMLLVLLAVSTSAAATLDVRAMGARGDGRTDDTAALQAAVDATARGGGVVLLRRGTFRSGMLRLRSRVTLRIEPSATLKAIEDPGRYPDVSPALQNSQLRNCRKAFVYAEGAEDVAIDGGGTIDGSGSAPQWTGDLKTHPEFTRPIAVFLVLCKRVRVQGVTVRDSAMWTLVNMQNEDVTLDGLHITSLADPTRDGIDLCDCHRARVTRCEIESEDDAICLKSGSSFGLFDVRVSDCRVKRSKVANGLKLGTASVGPCRDLIFERIQVQSVDKAAMAIESVDGSAVSHVVFRDIRIHDAGAALFVLLGSRGHAPVGTVNDLRFAHISGDAARHAWGAIIAGTVTPDGISHPIGGVRLDDVHVTVAGGRATVPVVPPEYAGQYPDPNLWGDVPAAGLWIRHAPAVSLTDCEFPRTRADARPEVGVAP